MSKAGYSQDACQSMVKSVEKNGNEMIGIDTVKYYQTVLVDQLCKGWITVHGKDYIDNTIVTTLNKDFKRMAAALQKYVDYMEQIATKVSLKIDETEPYVKISPKILAGQFNSDNSKAFLDVNGLKKHYLDDDALRNGKDAIDQLITNRLKKNHSEIVADWGKYGFAFESNGSSLVEEWKGAFNTAYNSVMKDLEAFKAELDRVLNSKIAETEQARANMNEVKNFNA